MNGYNGPAKRYLRAAFMFVFTACAATYLYTAPLIEERSAGGIDMIHVPAGTFKMGKTKAGMDYSPEHAVDVSGFWMSKYEVTQKLYADVTEQRPCEGSKYGEGEDLPVYNISWYEAVEFCNILSEQEGLKPYYNIKKDGVDNDNVSLFDPLKWVVTVNSKADGFRLPTEAQWEYACRAGTVTDFYWGKSASWDVSGKYSWHMFNAGYKRYKDKRFWWVKYHKAQKVGGRKPNAFGLYDMCGNVSEWCFDTYQEKCYTDKKEKDPDGCDGGYSCRVYRGGSFLDSPADFMSYRRWSMGAFEKQNTTGIRLVLPE